MLITLPISELKPGMYVERVVKQCDGAGIKIRTRGMVRDKSIIERMVEEGVQELLIDFDQSETPPPRQYQDVTRSKRSRAASLDSVNKKKAGAVSPQIITLEQEFLIASTCYEQSLTKLRGLYGEITQGLRINIMLLDQVANDIVDSVFRNPDAMAILTHLRDKHTYTWRHMMNSAILVAIFAKYLGYDIKAVREMALGALLHDIGLARVPQQLLSKPGPLNETEMQAMRKHVAQGLAMLKGEKGITSVMLDMLVNHHERLDGSGYPRGIKEDKLSRQARIMAIVDVYDAMTSDRPHKGGEEPIHVLRYLLSNRKRFDHALVQHFIKCVGVHPVGTIVKLTNERLALVLEGNSANPIKPKVKVFYNARHSHHVTAKDIELSKHSEDIRIVSSVKPNDYQLNLSRLLKEHLRP